MDEKLLLYRDVAFLYVSLFCQNCESVLHPPEKTDKGWEVELGRTAMEEGWLIEDVGHAYRILCPACARNTI
jgi:hypothetical protein